MLTKTTTEPQLNILNGYLNNMDNLDTNWTSIDLYYKGFHVKKSWPEDKGANALIEFIDTAIEKGFEPSWNKETSKEQAKASDPIMTVTEGQGDDLGKCPKCGAPNKLSKAGKPYCSKTCWLT